MYFNASRPSDQPRDPQPLMEESKQVNEYMAESSTTDKVVVANSAPQKKPYPNNTKAQVLSKIYNSKYK